MDGRERSERWKETLGKGFLPRVSGRGLPLQIDPGRLDGYFFVASLILFKTSFAFVLKSWV
jgi:hypothetical protein